MKNAYDLLLKMAQAPIEYGLWNKVDQRPFTDKEFSKVNNVHEISDKCIIMKPDEVWTRKLGTCWDCTLLEYVELKNIGYKELHPIYFEQQMPNNHNNDKITHSFIAYIEPYKNGYFWFEYAWYKQCGIHGPWNTMEELKENIKEAATICDKGPISYWKEDFDIESILALDEIGILDFVRVVSNNALNR